MGKLCSSHVIPRQIALYIPGRSEGNTGYFGLGDYLGDGHSAGKTYMEKLAAPKP